MTQSEINLRILGYLKIVALTTKLAGGSNTAKVMNDIVKSCQELADIIQKGPNV